MARKPKAPKKSPVKAAPAKPAAPEPASKPEPKPEPKPAEPKRSGRTVVKIEGPGTILLISSGGSRRVPTGVPVEVTASELAYLDHAGVPYTAR